MLALEFILFTTIYAIIPGLLIITLFDVKLEDKFATALVSFFVGMSILVLEYMIGMAVSIPKLVAVINPLFIVTMIIIWRKKFTARKELIAQICGGYDIAKCISFAGLFIVISVLSYLKVQSTFIGVDGLVFGVHPDALYAVILY